MANGDETVNDVCKNMRRFCTGGYLAGQGNMDYFADHILAAHDREIAAKDAEIERLRALVKEMADILKITARNYFECEDRICTLCGKKCGRNEATRLINTAREVCNV